MTIDRARRARILAASREKGRAGACVAPAASGEERMRARSLVRLLGAAMALGAGLCAARAEVATVRLAKHFGISYLPLTLMEEEQFLEKQARQRGLDLKAEWLRFTGGSGMNE